MRILKLTFLFLLIISCKQKKEEIKSELKIENQKSETTPKEVETKIEMDSVYKLYKKGEVEIEYLKEFIEKQILERKGKWLAGSLNELKVKSKIAIKIRIKLMF